jgi:hypothetical protein
MRETDCQEIFGQLRDAYDGNSSKNFGNGQRREYRVHFGMLAGVTPVIHEITAQHAVLGERYLKYSLGDNLSHSYENEIIDRAMSNVGNEIEMRKELSEIVTQFLSYIRWQMTQYVPIVSEDIKRKTIYLARFGARLRGTVSKERYDKSIQSSKPMSEVGSRLGKQQYKLMTSLAYVYAHTEVGLFEYGIAKKSMKDTVVQKVEDVVSALYSCTPTIDDSIKTRELSYKTHYNYPTTLSVLTDLTTLGVVIRTGPSNASEWTISEYIRDLIIKSDVYKK